MTQENANWTISATELTDNLSSVLDAVAEGRSFSVTRHGQPIAVLGPVGTSVGHNESADLARESVASYGSASSNNTLSITDTALTRFIGSRAARNVLALFVRDPDAKLHQREVARRAGVGLRSAQLALGHLERAGLVSSARDGNRRYYRAKRTARFEDLRSLLSREFGIAEVIARHLKQLEKRVELAFIFGSVAEGDDTVESDIDLLVVADATDDELVAPIAEAQRELGREIDLVTYRPAEFAERRAAGNHFIAAVLAGPRIDVVGDSDDA